MARSVRIGVFETNSSSCHSLSLMSLDMYESWRNGEIVIRFELGGGEGDPDDEDGDPETGFLATWGNFFLYKRIPTSVPREKRVEENIKLIRDFMSEIEDGNWVRSHWPEVEKDLKEYENTGIMGVEIMKHSPVALYMTQDEYSEFLNYDDCDSPFIYFFENSVAIGQYFRP